LGGRRDRAAPTSESRPRLLAAGAELFGERGRRYRRFSEAPIRFRPVRLPRTVRMWTSAPTQATRRSRSHRDDAPFGGSPVLEALSVYTVTPAFGDGRPRASKVARRARRSAKARKGVRMAIKSRSPGALEQQSSGMSPLRSQTSPGFSDCPALDILPVAICRCPWRFWLNTLATATAPGFGLRQAPRPRNVVDD